MRYYASFDGGGTKLIGVLFDENLEVKNTFKSGGVNANFLPEEQVKRNMELCTAGLLEGFTEDLEHIYISMTASADWLAEPLYARFPGLGVTVLGEGRMGLLAGICEPYGYAALSGTGSDVFFEGPDMHTAIGGWGLLLGDEGSGGWIGQKGLLCAIYAYDGRGGPTSLLEAACECYGFLPQNFHRELIKTVYQAPSPRQVLASFAPFVAREADAGDRAAQNVTDDAAREMAHQMNVLVKQVTEKNQQYMHLPATVCGGVWKGTPRMFAEFSRLVSEHHPGIKLARPQFDAVAGGAAAAGLDMGYSSAEVRKRLLHTFKNFKYE